MSNLILTFIDFLTTILRSSSNKMSLFAELFFQQKSNQISVLKNQAEQMCLEIAVNQFNGLFNSPVKDLLILVESEEILKVTPYVADMPC